MIGLGFTQPVLAEDEQEEENAEEQLGNFKEDGKSYYHLDAVPKDLNEEENFMDNITGNLWFLDSNEITQKMNEMFNYLANIAFDLNILMTNFMIFSLDFAYDFNFINTIIEKLEEIMFEISGITSNGNFSGSGIFGNLAIFAAVFAVIYAAFLMIWKRSMFASLGTILQTVIALAIAILLFTNYATFLTGLNQITTQASSLVLAGDSQEANTDSGAQPIHSDTPTNLDENSLKDGMKDNIWALFVDRPYMYMMYGETDLSNLAESEAKAVDRVNQILKEQPNSEARYAAISEELTSYQNDYVLYDNIKKRLSFTPMYLTINGIVSFPIYFLTLALLIFQFWFMLIAIFAPFALLFGAIPGQFNAIKRYFIELGLPLILKIVVSFTALVIFAISDLLYEADFIAVDNNNPFVAYIPAALIHFVLFMLIFLLRKRISNIFSAGSKGVQELRDAMGGFMDALKKGVQGTSTAAGALIGAAATGGAGTMAGAGIGSSLGKAATGEGSASEVAKSGMHAHRSTQLATLRKAPSESIPESQKVNHLSDEGAENIGSFIDERNIDTHSADNIMDAFDQNSVEHASLEDLNEAHDHVSQQAEKNGKLKGDYSMLLANHVKQQQEDRELQRQHQGLRRIQANEQQMTEKGNRNIQSRHLPESSEWVDDTPDMYTDNKQYDIPPKPINPDQSVVLNDESYIASNWVEDTPNFSENEMPAISMQDTESLEGEALRRSTSDNQRNVTLSGNVPRNDLPQGNSIHSDKVEPATKGSATNEEPTENNRFQEQQVKNEEKADLISLEKSIPPNQYSNENNDGYPTLD
ncbi:hypothetical protein GCM10027286_13010 [Virgibacillus ainsalahensis]